MEKKVTKAVTPVFRASFPSLFKATLNELNNKMEYSVMALFEKGTDLSELNKVVLAAAENKWGPDKKKWPATLRTPLRSMKEKAKEVDGKIVYPLGMMEGGYFATFKTSQMPGIVDQKRNDVLDENAIYPGIYLRASVNAFAYEAKGNKGVSLGLNNIQIVKDGERFGGRAKAETDFSALEMPEGSEGTADDIFA